MSRSQGEGGQAFLEEKGDPTLCDRCGTGNMELLCLMSNPFPSTLPCLSFPSLHYSPISLSSLFPAFAPLPSICYPLILPPCWHLHFSFIFGTFGGFFWPEITVPLDKILKRSFGLAVSSFLQAYGFVCACTHVCVCTLQVRARQHLQHQLYSGVTASLLKLLSSCKSW